MVCIDYAHTPAGIASVLNDSTLLPATGHGSVWCIFGCGGDRDSGKATGHGAHGARVCAGHVVVVDDNVRVHEACGDNYM